MGYDPQGTERTATRTAPDGRRRPARTPQQSADLTRILDALAHPHRRVALTVLRDAGWLSLDSLARAVLARSDVTVAGDDPLATVRLQLHHAHLPKLDDAGVIAYDPAERRAVRTVEDDTVRRLLDDAIFEA